MIAPAGGSPLGARAAADDLEASATSLREIARRIERSVGPVTVVGPLEVAVTAVAYDHRRVAPASVRPASSPATAATGHRELSGTVAPSEGALFCCLVGEHHDGHDYARTARANGAVAFVCERELGEAAESATQLVVGPGHAREAMAAASCVLWGDPAEALTTVGVTGTNGKTTTTVLLGSILEAAGYRASVVGTLSSSRTTPESPELQASLASARRAASSSGRPGAVALEVTSHGLVQHRADGFVHDVAVFTNLSQDHLDYHGTMEAYFEAKATLFTPAHARRGVVNAGDDYGRRLLDRGEIALDGFSLTDAVDLEMSAAGSRFRLGGEEVHLRLVGRPNVENALAAAAAARALGIDDGLIASGLSAVPAVPGRFEPVPNALGITAVVDYAHTPAGLARACETLRGLLGRGGRLVVVFGAGGDRDREKRPLMAEAVSSQAHVGVLTTDNPRHERPEAIVEAVRGGWKGSRELLVEVDRRRAISLALGLVGEGDVLLVAGKGHETTQQVGDEFLPFDDRIVLAEEAGVLAGRP